MASPIRFSASPSARTMIQNPYLNAVLAAAYIVLVVMAISFFVEGRQEGPGNETVIVPIAMLSLFVLSAAVMGYLFLYGPFALWFDGKRQEALGFFFRTVGVFALITVGIFSALVFLR